MKSTRINWLVGMTLAATWVPVTTVQADLLPTVIRGMQLFDYQFSGEKNVLGDGWTLNANAFYNNRRFNMGVADLYLTGQVNSSVGYTLRGIPSAEFSLNTGGQPLAYSLIFNNGIQDVTLSGGALVDIFTDINALGFYDMNFQISNRGEYTSDGFLCSDTGTLDYDMGPINVSGNIFADAVAALTQPLFTATGTENPFAKFSARATKAIEAENTANEIRSRIVAGEVVSDEEIAQLVNNTLVAAMLNGQPTDNLFDDLIIPEGLLAPETLVTFQPVVAGGALQQTPEPFSASLMMLPLAGLIYPRRRWAKRS